MTDWELILTMVGEKATTDITRVTDSQGFDECKESANEGGQVAKDTRESIEKRIGKSVISKKNFILKNKQNQLNKK
jgi:DNA-damage-inducible protein D